jgi:hypothetical protein
MGWPLVPVLRLQAKNKAKELEVQDKAERKRECSAHTINKKALNSSINGYKQTQAQIM